MPLQKELSVERRRIRGLDPAGILLLLGPEGFAVLVLTSWIVFIVACVVEPLQMRRRKSIYTLVSRARDAAFS